ncbi:MAG: hypothetical protein LBG22_10825 [Treponema sp.]|jgi:hypothetical protein|nr:hypothetical protein [Treponema sp.]
MADPELVRVMDYILNRCNERDIEAVAAAVIRRRRDLTIFGGSVNLPDPRRMAGEMSRQLNLEGTIGGLTKSIREYAMRIIRQEAPELSEEQAEMLTRTWIPDRNEPKEGAALPPDLLLSMIEQFVMFSRGEMDEGEDRRLRADLGAWPERYWNAFPQVIRLIITGYLRDEMDDGEFKTRINTAMVM